MSGLHSYAWGPRTGYQFKSPPDIGRRLKMLTGTRLYGDVI